MTPQIYVYVDHTSKYDGNSGVQRVVRALAVSLLAAQRDVVFVAWNPDYCALRRVKERELAELARYDGPAVAAQGHPGAPLHLNPLDEPRLSGAWLLIPEVPTSGGHGPRITADIIEYAGSKGMKTAFVFYDIVPLLTPGYEDVREAHAVYAQQLALADLVLPISRHAGDTLRAYYADMLKLPRSELPEIVDIPLAAAFGRGQPLSFPAAPTQGRISILSVGTIEPRKNQIGLLRAFNRLCRRRGDLDLELNLVGHLHPGVAAEVERLVAANSRVRYHRYLPDAEVAELYRASAFSVFPSTEEGFGLPIAESLWLRRPVICANFGAMAEIAEGGGCLAIDTRSDEEIETAIERLVDNQALRAKLGAEAGFRTFKSWDAYRGDVEAAIAAHRPLRRIWYYVNSTVRMSYNSGVQRVVRSLGRSLQELGLDVVFVRWDPNDEALREISPGQAAHLGKWHGPAPREGPSPEPSAGDWLIIPEITLPPGPTAQTLISAAQSMGMRVAYVFYDLIPLKLSPRWPDARAAPIYESAEAEQFEEFWKEMALADAVLPISRAAGADLLAWLKRTLYHHGRLEDRLFTTEIAGEFTAHARVTDASRQDAHGVFVILSAGTVEPRKNHLRLVQAFRDAAGRPGAPPMRLIIAGSQLPFPEYAAEVRAAAEGLDVKFMERADDENLAALYRMADLVAYASYEEGFGLPIVESAWFGRPCLCHNDGALSETAQGGAEMVDMLDAAVIAEALFRLASDPARIAQLTADARARPIRMWRDYAADVVRVLAGLGAPAEEAIRALPGFHPTPFSRLARPLLSICVTTYNRAGWLAHSLPRILDLTRPYRDVIEVLVCDNAATDNTPEVIARIAEADTFGYFRNARNVGMLGNLSETARRATGEFVWLIGDDDILVEGVIENVLEGILDHPQIEMVYLNYAITDFNNPSDLENIDVLIGSSRAIADGGPNRYSARLREVAALNENLFTAIYACIFRRNHALRAYTQNVSGPPFSTLLRCVPSTVYAMRMLLDRPAYWVGEPGVVVNLNVSWKEWLLLWRLERMPELYDWAYRERVGGSRIDLYRWNHAANAADYIRDVYFKASDEVREEFDLSRYLSRTLYLDAFRSSQIPRIRQVYKEAAASGRLKPGDPSPEHLFASFGLDAD